MEKNEKLSHRLAEEYWNQALDETHEMYTYTTFPINMEEKVKKFLKEKKKKAGFLQSILISLVTKMVIKLLLDWLLDGLTKPPPYTSKSK